MKYRELAWNISEEELVRTLESLEMKQIKQIAKEGGMPIRTTKKEKAIESIVKIIMSRRTRGDVFKETRNKKIED